MWVKGEILHSLNAAHGGVSDALTRAGQPRLFDRLTWFKLLWLHNPIGARPLIARSWAQGARCWLFLAEQGKGDAISLANYYSLAFRPVWTGGDDGVARNALLVALARRLRHGSVGLATINMTPVPTRDGSDELLEHAFVAAGWHVYSETATYNWVLRLQGRDFKTYWAERPGEVRNTLNRKLKKSAVKTEIHTRIDDALWAEYEEIYADSWKPEEGSLAFLRALAMHEGKFGALRFGIARHEGRAIAAQLWTIEPGPDGPRAIIHKLAHREDAQELSPGTILTHAMFRQTIDEDKVTEIDFGTGDDGYKAQWMEDRYSLKRIVAHNPRRVKGIARSAKAKLRNLARRGAGD